MLLKHLNLPKDFWVDKVSMIMKYQNHKLQTTNRWHPMEEPQIPYLEQFA